MSSEGKAERPAESSGEPAFLARGRALWRQGDPAQDAFVLRSGLVKTFREAQGRSLALMFCPAGRMLGLPECLLGAKRLTTAVALEDCTLERIPKPRLQEPRWAFIAQESLCREVIENQMRLAALACRPARKRFERILRLALSALPEACGEAPDGISLPISQRDAAEMTGITPPHLSRLLQSLGPSLPFRWQAGSLIVGNGGAFRQWLGDGSGLPHAERVQRSADGSAAGHP